MLHLFSFNPPIMGGFLSEKTTLLCALSMHKGVKEKNNKENTIVLINNRNKQKKMILPTNIQIW